MKMKQGLLILLLIGFGHIRTYAQNWSEEDSVWLSNVLSGKDTIRINPEFQKAIREGKFIHSEDEPGQQLLDAPLELPILTDFSEYLHADSDSVHHRKLDYKSLPPSVYRLYVIELDTGISIGRGAYTTKKSFTNKDEIKLGKLPVAVSGGARNLYSDVVKDGQKRGTITGSAKLYFSLDDVLMWVFSKKERQKKKNRKRENTWRYYNEMP
ncbi:hypothetical protein [Parabacteroides sp.]